ncbi:MAG: PAQR family membrane homeostasis protein TrhA [Acidimicrobiales bacterium]
MRRARGLESEQLTPSEGEVREVTRPASKSPRPEPRAAASGAKPLLRGWLHAGGLLATLVAGPVLIAQAPTVPSRASLIVYVVSLLGLFGVSTAFHRVAWSLAARRRMRRADHSTIFLAIAGTYTAVAVLALSGAAEIVILSIAWGGAAVGLAVRQLILDAPKWAVAVPYVVVGWAAVAVVPQLGHGLGWPGFAVLLLGGLFYTAGAIVYAKKRPDPRPAVFGYHEIFHSCTVIGATLHFVAIAGFALPRYRY